MKQPVQNLLRERALLLFIGGFFLICSPVRYFWADEFMPWYSPYLIWFGLIILTWFLYRWLKRHEF